MISEEVAEFAKIPGVRDKFKKSGWNLSDAEVEESYDGWGWRVDIDGEGWNVYPDYNTAERVGQEQVQEQLESDPEMFNQDWLWNFSSLSDTDARVTANDLADMDLEGARDNGEIDEEDDEAEDNYLLERYEEHYKALKKDPKYYLVEELGLMDTEQFFKTYPNAIDTKEAAEDAIQTDGLGHFLSPYDGEEEDHGETIWFRQD